MTDTLVGQLVEFYYVYDQFQEPRIPEPELRNTLFVLLQKNRILVCVEGDQLLGYVECWRVNFEQLGRLMCHVKPFDVGLEDIEHGNICYINNTTIHPEYRRSWVARYLRTLVFDTNRECEFFLGEALRKRTQPVKIFRADAIHYAKELSHGESQRNNNR